MIPNEPEVKEQEQEGHGFEQLKIRKEINHDEEILIEKCYLEYRELIHRIFLEENNNENKVSEDQLMIQLQEHLEKR